MENSQTTLPVDFAVEEEAYSQVLKNNLDVSTELPPWRSRSDVWSEWIQSLRNYAKELYEKYFKPDESPKLDWVNWDIVLMALYILFWLAVVVLVVYLLVSFFRKQADSSQYSSTQPAISIETREQRLVILINEMMTQGEWAKAAKLRWRLFLERKNLQVEITPLEFEKENATTLPKAIDQYRNMFTTSKGDENWYLGYNRKLRDLEDVP